MMVRDFQSVIGKETKHQILAKEKKLPGYLLACVGGGSNSLGLFYPFLEEEVELIGIEAGGLGLSTSRHGATLAKGSIGVLHGSKSYLLQDRNGQIRSTHSVAPGLDYPGVGPEHSYLKKSGRVKYYTVTDSDALEAFRWLSQIEGIIPALESAHAIAYLKRLAPGLNRDEIVIVNLSGRGDKDLEEVSKK